MGYSLSTMAQSVLVWSEKFPLRGFFLPLLKSRQIINQPASPRTAKGRDRVVRQHSDLADFKFCDVLKDP